MVVSFVSCVICKQKGGSGKGTASKSFLTTITTTTKPFVSIPRPPPAKVKKPVLGGGGGGGPLPSTKQPREQQQQPVLGRSPPPSSLGSILQPSVSVSGGHSIDTNNNDRSRKRPRTSPDDVTILPTVQSRPCPILPCLVLCCAVLCCVVLMFLVFCLSVVLFCGCLVFVS